MRFTLVFAVALDVRYNSPVTKKKKKLKIISFVNDTILKAHGKRKSLRRKTCHAENDMLVEPSN